MTRPFLALLLSCLMLAASPGTQAGSGDTAYQQGMAQWRNGQREPARSLWLKAAEQGHAEAAYRLALLHNNHQNAADMKMAARWFRQAANGGIAGPCTTSAFSTCAG